ncbi:MAG: hypothetical protein WC430_03970 [Patescibacteria group bacterium]
MVSELEEQERRRQFKRVQQQSRIGESLPEASMATPEESAQAMERKNVDRTEAASAETIPLEAISGEESNSINAVRARSKAIAARLKADRAQEAAKTEPGGEVIEKAKELKDTVQRLTNIYRIISGASAITLVGLPVSFLIMNARGVFGNLLKTKFLPALAIWEIILVGLLNFIFVIALFFLILLLTIGANPGKIFEFLLTGALQSIKNFFSLS